MNKKLNVDISEQPNIVCDECGNHYFEQLFVLKKVNKLLLGTSTDEVVPFITYRCVECQHINKEFKIFEDDE